MIMILSFSLERIYRQQSEIKNTLTVTFGLIALKMKFLYYFVIYTTNFCIVTHHYTQKAWESLLLYFFA